MKNLEKNIRRIENKVERFIEHIAPVALPLLILYILTL
jgi:hypothetical protein